MKRLKSLLVASLLVCGVGLSRAQNDIQELHIVEGQMMVLIDGKTTIEEWCAKMQEAGVIGMEPLGRLSQSMNLWLVEYPAANMPAENALLLATRERTTQIVQFNHTNLELRNTPNDPLFSDQWSLFNDGSNGGSGTADIDALDAWDITTGGLTARGDTIVVAVIDGGFQMTHEDLEANMFVNHHEVPGNGLDDDGNGYVDDVQGWNAYTNNGTQSLSNHGTHVAGTVGAIGNNNTGVTGVNWDVKVMAISGSSSLESTVVAAYSYALDMRRLYNQTGGEKGAYVVATNSSFGVNYGDPIDYPLWCAMYDSLGMQGVLSAGATANLNINVDVTGDIPTACGSNFLISVTNSTSSDVKNSGAAYGVTTIDLAAPGTNIHSTTNSGYGSLTGTSMATPHVAGAVALMYSAVCENVIDGFGNNHPGLAVYVKEKLLNEGVDQLASLQGLLLTEGRLNLYQAVRSVADSCITVQLSVLDSDCGMCNGSIQSNIVGGVSPYQYFWSMGDTTASINGLCAGSYNLTVVDAENDSSMASAVVSDIGGPSLSFNVQDLSCFNSGDGAVSLNGGDAYLWSDGGTSALRNDLSAGTYFVSATDNSGCTTVVSIELHQPSEILVTFEAQIPVPYNASNGVLVAHVSGGLGPYSYTWSEGAGSDSVLNGLDVGLYSLTVEDAAGCIDTTSYFLGYPAGLGEHVPVTTILFPNPTRGQVELKGMPGGVSVVQVFDHRGALCYATKVSGTSASLQLGGLAAGPYFLRLRSSEGVTVHRLYIVE